MQFDSKGWILIHDLCIGGNEDSTDQAFDVFQKLNDVCPLRMEFLAKLKTFRKNNTQQPATETRKNEINERNYSSLRKRIENKYTNNSRK